MGEWRRIESVPRDGSWVDLWIYHPDYEPGYPYPGCRWDRDLGWVDKRGHTAEAMKDAKTGEYLIRATHWKPYPEPPNDGE